MIASILFIYFFIPAEAASRGKFCSFQEKLGSILWLDRMDLDKYPAGRTGASARSFPISAAVGAIVFNVSVDVCSVPPSAAQRLKQCCRVAEAGGPSLGEID